jgi:hypothetical protein
MRRLLLAAVISTISVAASPAMASGTASAKTAKPAARVADKPFGLTQAMAVLRVCPEGRFENASIIALGGVLQENKARLEATPVNKRMDFMNQVVQEEQQKTEAWLKVNKVDCSTDVERAAGYWNKTIATIAKDQGQPTPQMPKSGGAAPQPQPVERGVPGTALSIP